MSELCHYSIIQHSISSFSDNSGGTPGPSDISRRSTSGDTGEGERVVNFQSESHITRQCEMP